MNISTKRDAKRVWIRIRLFEHQNLPTLDLHRDMASELTAEVMRQRIETDFHAAVRTVREQAYAEGWSDAKKKKRKKTEFREDINTYDSGCYE
jgi:hypothetical protein